MRSARRSRRWGSGVWPGEVGGLAFDSIPRSYSGKTCLTTLPKPEEAAMAKKLEDLRSQRWFGATDLRSFGHRSRTVQVGLNYNEFMGKPVIGIINTWSEMNPCH